MPARRSRTERWRDSLHSLVERNGPIEITVDSPDSRLDLVWKVRLLSMDDESLIVEQPMTLHKTVPVDEGSEIIGAIAIGQNRWMFRTRVLEHVDMLSQYGTTKALRLAMPINVERCQRRNFYRTSTTSLQLAPIQVFQLMDPDSAVPLEIATQAAVVDSTAEGHTNDPFEIVKPELGQSVNSRLLNIGGGGVGLLINADETSALNKHHLFWMRLDLTPAVQLPLSLTARLAHTRIDSSGDAHCGFAFDFIRNRSYEPFVAEQICRYVSQIQKPNSGERKAA
ncbi:MAG: hypothetical protein Phyf2KO_02390 [Phycisphaerales bacterium]